MADSAALSVFGPLACGNIVDAVFAADTKRRFIPALKPLRQHRGAGDGITIHVYLYNTLRRNAVLDRDQAAVMSNQPIDPKKRCVCWGIQ